MLLNNKRYLMIVLLVLITALIVFSLNTGTPSIFDQASNNSASKQDSTQITNTQTEKPNSAVSENPALQSDNTDQVNTTNKQNPQLSPGFPEPLPPLNDNDFKQVEALISQGDSIIAEMEALISGADISALRLSEQQQAELDAKAQQDQAKIDELQIQLDALKRKLAQ